LRVSGRPIAPGRQRGADRGRIVSFDRALADDGERHGAGASREELVVRVLVFIDVLRGECHVFS
jgi:hypothetical protein